MISALLHLLRAQEAPRLEVPARNAATFAELSSSEVSELSVPSPREIREDNLEGASMTRPLIPQDAPPVPTCINHELTNYIKTVDRLTKAPDNHALDVFE